LRSLEMLRPPSTRGRLPRLYSHLADEPVPERLISLAGHFSCGRSQKSPNRRTQDFASPVAFLRSALGRWERPRPPLANYDH
jgi:hypothetical protein